MRLRTVTKAWRDASIKFADRGIPVPMFRDPFSKRPSLPFTMVVSAVILVIVGMVGKLSLLVGGIDKGAAMQFLTTSSALYFGHSWVHNETTDMTGRTQSTDIQTGAPGRDPNGPSQGI